MKIPVEVSARHFHASLEDYRTLFGDEEPKIVKELSQKGQFASDKEAKLIVGGQELTVRFLGPYRKSTQVEITKTEAYKLKIDPPVTKCVCGAADESAAHGAMATLKGPVGEVSGEFVIIALRHLHINPTLAKELNLEADSYIKIAAGSERRLIFDKVLCRINENFTFDIHLDTDEANAAGVSNGDEAELLVEG
jgi:putative phosphotransacetylase